MTTDAVHMYKSPYLELSVKYRYYILTFNTSL